MFGLCMNLPYVLLKRPFGKLLTYSYNCEHTHTQSTHLCLGVGWFGRTIPRTQVLIGICEVTQPTVT